jgi:Protein of unknown function (DUF4038)/Putative collagen-binding domain of a collagenase
MRVRKICPAVLLALIAVAELSAQSKPLPRLRVSENGRFFVKEGGAPFFYLGDTAWCLFTRPTHEEVDRYLMDRASKGFTVIQGVFLIWDGLRRPNPLGQTLLVDGNAAQINQAFFENADYIVNKAESLGLYVLILPLWAKTFLGREPYLFDPTTAYDYGKFIGARYRQKPVLWMLGGDRPGKGVEEVTAAMARGLRDGDGGAQLVSYHPTGRQSSSMWFHNESWLDFNSIQSGHSSQNRNYELVASDYQLKPAKPVIDAEAGYENITDGLKQAVPDIKRLGAWDVRRYGYLGVLAGAAGYAYGCGEVYEFWKPGMQQTRWMAGLPWQESMQLPGASQMKHLRTLIESRPMLVRIPDQSMLVSDPMATTDRIQAARASDGSYAFVYTASGRPIEVRLDSMSGKTIRASWYDPRTGASKSLGEFPKTATREFKPPSSGENNDWVLVLDAAAGKFPVPGE